MKKITFLLAAISLLSINYAQNTINLTFTAGEGYDFTQLDSIKVINRTQGGDTVLNYPDTVLSLLVTGVNELADLKSSFQLNQNYPNPFTNQTSIKIQLPESGNVNLTVTDILGRIVMSKNQELGKGLHSFSFTPGGDEIYFLTARLNNVSSSIKMLCAHNELKKNASLVYTGSGDNVSTLKTVSLIQSFNFNFGDQLLYIGY